MATVFTVGITAGVPTSGTGTVSTIDNMLGAAGSPSANYLSVQSTIALPISVSSAAPVFLSSQSGQITVSASITGGTITSLTSGTVAVSGGAVFTAPGTPSATQVLTVQFSTNSAAASVVAVSSGTITLSSNPTITSVSSGAVSIINGANTAAVKAASTPAAATDPGLVVSLSPNGLNANGQATSSNSAPVVIASDQSAITSILSSTGTNTVVVSSITGGTITSLTSGTVTQASTFQTFLVPRATGGLLAHTANISSGAVSTLVSSVPAQFYRVETYNNSAVIGYIRIYDTSSAPTAGTTALTLKKQILVPCSTGIGAGVISNSDYGIPCTVGIGYTFTSGIGSTTAGTVESSAYLVNIDYR